MQQMQERQLPADIVEVLRKAGDLWAKSPERQRPTPVTISHWHNLIQEWSRASDMPLLVRKTNLAKDKPAIHPASRRKIVFTDNSPAQWVFYCALKNCTPSLNEIKEKLENHEIPIVMAASKAQLEIMEYKGILSKCGVRLNAEGWKLCHIDHVSPAKRTKPENDTLENLCKRFVRFMDPANHFLVPINWSGFGELPEVIEAIKVFENHHP